jgi:GMP synthase-like glutamine amidotransferase
MKRIHIFQHVQFEGPGCIEKWIEEKSYNVTRTEFFAGDHLPDVRDIDWLIIMGGHMGVYDTAEFPWLIDEKRFIRQAIDHGKTVLGICLGSQLIAEVLGGDVARNKEKEIGWFPVKKVVTGNQIPILKLFDETETVFHWHGDTFTIPDGAIHILSSDACHNQCFMYGDRTLGLQFHLEITRELLDSFIESGDELIPAPFIQTKSEIIKGYLNIKRNNDIMYSILEELDKN